MKAREIEDTGLRLSIMNALIARGALDEGVLRARLQGIVAEAEDEDARISEALRRLAEIDLDPHALVEIEALDFDGGNDIYMLIEEEIDVDTGGETNHYELNSLAGVERLTALRSLDLDGYGYRGDDLDLAPLRDHPALASVVLSGRCIHAEALESVPSLVKLSVALGQVDDDAILERLAARGVELSR
jgi:hypothetical protein